ncbi:Rho GTPase-activating protein 32 [Araneus ventricosus]|uniref:Rho GTPase-activating protein 32 n=1 Tax=Araneus ventricosus TaxID=182803 RepID=A0A4Y2H0I8_ARAVE|nr:Rho GTPase-activating protein 32 [Araneus ventricosus]
MNIDRTFLFVVYQIEQKNKMNSDATSRFPKLDECAHFHYDNVELGPIEVVLCDGDDRIEEKNACVGELWYSVQVTSNGKSWQIRRSLDNFQMLDRQLHRCVYDRKFSLLKEIAAQPQQPEDAVRTMLTQYLERFSQLAGSLINCGPVLNWLELDNRGNRLIVTDEAAINTPAVAAAYVIKRYASQANDEISLEVGDIISVIDMPPPKESSWWRGKKGFQVGFFPCECVEIIGDKVPQSFKIPKAPTKPVLRKHGKLIAFFRSFLLSRPSRRKLKQSGILKERVFGCDLGEHLMNTGRDIPLVLKCCTEFIEQHGIVDGIYRLSGVTSNIQKLRLAFDEDRVPNLLDEAIIQDIHCVASLLKMYFRELPNPLLTFHLYDKFVNAVQADEDVRLLKLRDVVQQLPPPHYRSLEYLMRHLSKVAAYGFQTGMTPKNVAIVWAPNLLRRRSVGKSKKSPSGWKSFFSRGWQTTSGRRKNRRLRSERPKIGSPIFSELTPLVLQDKAVTESDVSHTNTKKLRTVKSAENLFPLSEDSSQQSSKYAFSPLEEAPSSPQEFASDASKEGSVQTSTPSKTAAYQKHVRSISHDSYFERNIEFAADTESEIDDRANDSLISSDFKDSSGNLILHSTALKDDCDSLSSNDSPSKRSKTAQKQKLMNFESEASSPKLQKLSLKRLYHTLSSPPMEKKKDESKREKNSSLLATAQKELHSHDSVNISQGEKDHDDHEPLLDTRPASLLLQESTTSVPSIANSVQSSNSLNISSSVPHEAHETDVVTAEVHRSLPENQMSEESRDQDDNAADMTPASVIDESDNLMDFSMEATLSESVNLSQLMSFDSQEQVLSIGTTENTEKQSGISLIVHDGSLTTPESPTGDCISEIPSSGDSENNDTNDDANKEMMAKDFQEEISNKSLENGAKCTGNELFLDETSQTPDVFNTEPNQNADDQLVNQTQQLYIDMDTNVNNGSENIKQDSSLNISNIMSLEAHTPQKDIDLEGGFVNDIILSPPASFVDTKEKVNGHVKKDTDLASDLVSDIRSSAKYPCARSMERSKTEVHEICAKFVSGIAVSGSFGQELFKANNDFVDSHKKKSCSDKISPISPIEDSKRKFESEIGRLIVRDRQMKLEMEQMKAERQKHKVETPTSTDVNRNKSKSEKKFVEAVEFRKSPIKSLDNEKQKLESDDLLKVLKGNVDVKKSHDSLPSYSRYVRMDNKPSVKELLSKFEGNKRFDDSSQKLNSDLTNSSPKQTSSGVFSNVQVINHNYPLSSSKSFASDFDESLRSSKDNQRSRSKEHIFQTECVIRFPHPKSAILNQTEFHKNGIDSRDVNYDSGESNSWTSGQYDHQSKVCNSRTAFLSSDNLTSSSTLTGFSNIVPESASPDQSRMSQSLESKTLSNSLQNGRDQIDGNCPDVETPSNSFSSFKETFNRANRLTQQMRYEFFQRGLSQNNGNDTSFFAQDNSSNHYSRSPPVNRKRQAPTRQRPKSVPPPICRLSFVTGKQTSPLQLDDERSHAKIIPTQTEYSQNVPKTSSKNLSNGKESTDTSQTYGPPKRVRDRAALFERSLSFSGPMDKRTLPSSKHSQNAQKNSSKR